MQASRKAAAEEAGRGKPRDKRPRIARTSRGLGVFAQQRYFARRLIGEVQGTVIDDWGYESRYCMDLGDSRCLEPAAPFRYVNHSCQPNCFIQWRDVTSDRQREPQRRMFLLAIDDIAVGDELTIDYAWPAHMTMPCRCRSEQCRGWIVAADELEQLLADQAKSSAAPGGTDVSPVQRQP